MRLGTSLSPEIRLWRWWCKNGPKNRDGGTIGGSFMMRRLRDLYALPGLEARRTADVCIDDVGTLYVDVLDLRTWHVLLPHLEQDDPELQLARTLNPHGGVFVDVGANVGQLSLFALTESTAAVHSFEPNPAMVRLLRRSRSENPLAARWHLHESAVGSSPGRLDLYFDAHFSGTASLNAQWQGQGAQTVQIPIVTLDEWYADERVRQVDVLKMDVEGWEAEVVAGGSRVIASNKPYVWFEHNLSALRRSGLNPERVLERLQALGYSAYWDIGRFPDTKSWSPRELAHLNEGRINLLAVPAERSPDFLGRVLPRMRALRGA